MRTSIWSLLAAGLLLAAAPARAEDPAAAPADPAQAAMAEMMKRGSPGPEHQVFQPLVGKWTYTAQWWMAPDAPAQTMSGTSENSLAMDGRFLKEKVKGEATQDHPAFEGLGFLGYDNIRQEYQSLWLDNMSTSLMMTRGKYDAAAKTLTFEGDFSCPMTGEAHRYMRSTWQVVDADHSTYTSYSKTPDGKEFKSMELRYTRAQ